MTCDKIRSVSLRLNASRCKKNEPNATKRIVFKKNIYQKKEEKRTESFQCTQVIGVFGV